MTATLRSPEALAGAGRNRRCRRAGRTAVPGIAVLALVVALGSCVPAEQPQATLSSVACLADQRCMAVGGSFLVADSGGRTLAERGSPSGYSLVASPNRPTTYNFLRDVACTSTANCVAVGQASTSSDSGNDRFHTIIERWNGTRWAIASSPEPSTAAGEDVDLRGVTCRSASDCWAVGDAHSAKVALALHWDGSHWSIVPTGSSSHDVVQVLDAVSCPSSSECVAVGLRTSSREDDAPASLFAQRWDGSHWSIISPPNPGGTENDQLEDVSCTGPADCTAVGEVSLGSGEGKPLVERWDGSHWSPVVVPSPANAQSVSLTSISCTASTTCAIVGSFINRNGTEQSLSLMLDGTQWTVGSPPLPSHALYGSLGGVSCTSSTVCTAVGSYGPTSDQLDTLVERWNGTRWSIVPSANPGPY